MSDDRGTSISRTSTHIDITPVTNHKRHQILMIMQQNCEITRCVRQHTMDSVLTSAKSRCGLTGNRKIFVHARPCFTKVGMSFSVTNSRIAFQISKFFNITGILNHTGGHCTRVAAVTLDNMAKDAVAASASLRQILTESVRYCGPAFVSWLSVLGDTLTPNPGLQWLSPVLARW